MQIVRYSQPKHYDLMLKLWKKRGWQPCPADSLPRYGLVAEEDDGKFIAYMVGR